MAGEYAPYNTAIPGADQYASADVMATNAYNKALTQINQNRLNTLTNYGYTGTVDPTSGVVSGVRIDPNSVYGGAQQLFHTQAIEDRDAENAAMDRGLHGGLAHQAGSELHYQHGAQRTALGNALQGDLRGYDANQQSAAETRDNALWQAQQAALQAKMQEDYTKSITDLLDELLHPSTDSGSTDSTPPPIDTSFVPGEVVPAPGRSPVVGGYGPLIDVGDGTYMTAPRITNTQTTDNSGSAKAKAVQRLLKGGSRNPMMI